MFKRITTFLFTYLFILTLAFPSHSANLSVGVQRPFDILAVEDAKTDQPQAVNMPFGDPSKNWIDITNDGGWNGYPYMALLADGTFVVSYKDGFSHGSYKTTDKIVIKKSTDRGLTWGSAITILQSNSTPDEYVMGGSIDVISNGDLIAIVAVMDENGDRIVDGNRVFISSDGGDTWGSAYTVDSNFTLQSNAGQGLIELANGDLLFVFTGKDTGDTWRSLHVMKSTDDGATWGDEATIADGEADSLEYIEGHLALRDNGDVYAMIRTFTATDTDDWFQYSISDDSGATWSAPIKAFYASGNTAMGELTSGMWTINYRSKLNDSSYPNWRRPAMRVSLDEGTTWSPDSEEFIYDTNTTFSSNGMSYSAIEELELGLIGVVWGAELIMGSGNDTAGEGDIRFTYFCEGACLSPFGMLGAKGITTYDADVTVYNAGVHLRDQSTGQSRAKFGFSGIAANDRLDGYYYRQKQTTDSDDGTLSLSGDVTNFQIAINIPSTNTGFWDNDDGVGTYARFAGLNNTLLDGTIDDSATTITVDSTTGFPTANRLSIDSEEIDCTGTGATTFTTCTRGVNGSVADSHNDNSPVIEMLKFEVESYDTSGEDAWYSVNIPVLDADADTDIYLVYGHGNPSDGSDKETTWDSNYVAVWHLNEDKAEGEMDDSTSNNNDGTDGSTSIAGKIDKGRDLNGSSEYIQVGDSNSLDFTTNFTMEMWIYRDVDSGGIERIIAKSDKDNSSGIDFNYFFQIIATDLLEVGVAKGDDSLVYLDSSGTISTGQWYHIVATKDNTEFQIFIDGVLDANGITSGTMGDAKTTTFPLQIGRLGSGGTWFYGFDGKIDEITFSNSVRTLDWVKAREYSGLYANPDTGGSWLTFGQHDGAASEPPNLTINDKTGNRAAYITEGLIEIDKASGGCLKVRDTDDAGWSYGTVLNGVITWSGSSCE